MSIDCANELDGASASLVFGRDRVADASNVFGHGLITAAGLVIITDHQGTVRQAGPAGSSAPDRYAFDAFGVPTDELTLNTLGQLVPHGRVYPTDYGYTGEQFDAGTGLQFNRARWLRLTTSQWGDPDMLPCFPAETLVHTPTGVREISQLQPGDLVLAYDSVSNHVVPRHVTACTKNWTLHLVKITICGEVIWATRNHPVYLPEQDAWINATALKAGMVLLDVRLRRQTIDLVELMGTEEDTFNISVAELHTFFVGKTGVLVHNSSFENLDRVFTGIYLVRDPNGNPVHVGQTIQGVETRFGQHIGRGHPEWAGGFSAIPIDKGNWTKYEAAVREQHHMDRFGGKTALENKELAITEKKYQKYKHLHDPC